MRYLQTAFALDSSDVILTFLIKMGAPGGGTSIKTYTGCAVFQGIIFQQKS